MEQELEYFKQQMKAIRGDRSTYKMAKDAQLISNGSWQGLEQYANPRLLSLLNISKSLDLEITIKNGKILIT